MQNRFFANISYEKISIIVELLNGSPFHSYMIPGLILFFIVGGSFLTACIAVIKKYRSGRMLSFLSVLIVFVWLAVQVSIIGYISWMQPATAIASLIILTLTYLYQKNTA